MRTFLRGIVLAAGLAALSLASPASAAFTVRMNSAQMDYTYRATVNGGGTIANGINFNVTQIDGGVGAGTTYDLFAFCIDVFHHIDPGNVAGDYYSSTYGTQNPNAPLFNGNGVELTGAALNKITNLADIGLILHRDRTAANTAEVSLQTAAIQAAIWTLEGHTVTLQNSGATAQSATTYGGYYAQYLAVDGTVGSRVFTLTDTTYGSDQETNHQGFVVGWPPEGGVPEPATWALMFTGFFGAGLVLRRRVNVIA